MHGSISSILWLLALFSLSVFERIHSDVSLGESSLQSNNSKKFPVQSNLKDGKRVETCITEVLAQKRKPQDTNLFSVPVRSISPLLPLTFFHIRWSARKYFFNNLQMFIFFLTTPRANSVPVLLSPFFFCHRGSVEQSPNKSTAFSSKVDKVLYKGEQAMRVPSAQRG